MGDLKERLLTRLTARPAPLTETFLLILCGILMSAVGFNGIAVIGWVAGWRNWTAFKLDGGAPSDVTREPSALGVAGVPSPAVLGNVRHFSNGRTIHLFNYLSLPFPSFSFPFLFSSLPFLLFPSLPFLPFLSLPFFPLPFLFIQTSPPWPGRTLYPVNNPRFAYRYRMR